MAYKISVVGATPVIVEREKLTTGMVGATLEILLDNEWDDLSATAVFRDATNNVVVDVLQSSWVDGVATIPWECMQNAWSRLEVGVYGTNVGGTVVIRTPYICLCNSLPESADPSGDASASPTQAVWAQIQTALAAEVQDRQDADTAIGNDVDAIEAAYLKAAVVSGDTLTLTKEDSSTVVYTPDIPTKLSDLTDDLGSNPTHTHSQYAESSNLSAVATSGAYSDLSGTPNLAAVATSGSYNDLSNQPSIPSTYVKSASVSGDTLTLIDQSNTTITFQGGGGSLDVSIAKGTDTDEYAVRIGDITADNVASGSYSVAAGRKNTVSGAIAVALGRENTSSGNASSAIGYKNTSSGVASSAIGYNAKATAQCAMSFGQGTTASGTASHADGYYTTANHLAQHVFGQYNVSDPSANDANSRGDYIEIVGNGVSGSPSNARTLDWTGNEVLAGKLTVGAGPTNNMDVATKQYVDAAIPAVPVTSVNTKTGAVVLSASDVGALADNTGFVASATYNNGVLTLTDQSGTAQTVQITDLFVCEYDATTYAEVTAAVAAGLFPVCPYGAGFYIYGGISNNYHCFGSFRGTNYVRLWLGTNNRWGDATIDLNDFLTSAPVASVNGQTGAVVIANATTSAAGLMSATDKANLDAVYADYSSAISALGV